MAELKKPKKKLPTRQVCEQVVIARCLKPPRGNFGESINRDGKLIVSSVPSEGNVNGAAVKVARLASESFSRKATEASKQQ